MTHEKAAHSESSSIYQRLAVILFFGVMTVLFTFPVGDGDFFWHVKTGQWIWTHRALPAVDPFTFTTALSQPSERIFMILKQYWLGQLAFYGIWHTWGEAGMVALRAAIYSGILVFIYRWTSRHRGGLIPLCTVFLVGNVLRNYPNERPQLFAYAFFVLMLYLLERILDRQRESSIREGVALCLLMVLWSNCHGSYIVGVVLLGISLATHATVRIVAREPVGRSTCIILIGSMLATLLNPTGFTAFAVFFGLKQDYTSRITEYVSPITLALRHHLFDYAFWALVVLTILVLVMRNRQIRLQHLAIVLPLLVLAMTGVRYLPFFALAAPLVTRYLPEVRANGKLALVPLVAVLIWAGGSDYHNTMKFRAEKAFPLEAASFLNRVKPPGNIFNYMPWGGYLMCHTTYPVFVDGRALNEEYIRLHDAVLAGDGWQQILDRYAIQTMIIPGTDMLSTSAYPVLLQMLQETAWVLVHQDDVALVFVRNTPQNRDLLTRHALSKDLIAEHIKARWQWQSTLSF